MLAGVCGEPAPPDLAAQIHERSGGNPYFVEELLAAYLAGPQELPASVRDAVRGHVHGGGVRVG